MHYFFIILRQYVKIVTNLFMMFHSKPILTSFARNYHTFNGHNIEHFMIYHFSQNQHKVMKNIVFNALEKLHSNGVEEGIFTSQIHESAS